MEKTKAAKDPDAYVDALNDWRQDLVGVLREAVLAASALDEKIKWGHIVYLKNGPVALIRAEEERVLFGFWRGQRLTEIEPRLKAGGKYEMATMEFREGMSVAPAIARRLITEAVSLNEKLGDPTNAAKIGGNRQGQYDSMKAVSEIDCKR